MKCKGFTLVEALVVIVVLAIIAAILFPVFARRRETPHRGSCTSNLKQIGLGLAQYIQDYDERFPPARNAVGGWAELVFPYIKSTQVFHCPSEKNGAGKTTDYFTNARLSGVAAEKIAASHLSVVTGDGLANQPLDANLSQLPAAWIRDSNSPAFRHLDGAHYGFVDGHVKWFKPERITLDAPSKNNPTFLVKP